MLYLSRLSLNPRSRQVQRHLADCQRLHECLLDAFGDAPDSVSARTHFGVLYRVETDRGRSTVLVQSVTRPDWSHLPATYLLRDAESKEIGEAYQAIGQGTRLAFRLRANPTKRLMNADTSETSGKRVDLRRPEEQLGWLERKADAGGFRILSTRIAPAVPNVRIGQDNKQLGHKRGQKLTFGSVLFEGALEVIDAPGFRATLRDGVGSGKAYGFGLLSVAPLR
ncbi:MAG TPA: type I-E CRISPR-associated protein Cas6/Cse3/CasE [Chloroflexota bacterium]|nr:type I-E CRISPR-associated protein Cas6/Cse3/CasE [Chloroflexota bacterium]